MIKNTAIFLYVMLGLAVIVQAISDHNTGQFVALLVVYLIGLGFIVEHKEA